MDKKIYAYDFLNHGVGGITDEMTIHKHVLKKTPFLRHSVSAVVHFYSVSILHIKGQKKNEYDQQIPQSYTADQDQA